MNLPDFLNALFEHGRTVVGQFVEPISNDDRHAALEILSAAEQTHRLEFPGAAPQWSPIAGLWAAEMFYAAAQLAIERDIGQDALNKALNVSCPAAANPSCHYSVDLVFQFLPDLYHLARRQSADDPLVAILNRWAVNWPLSSVGIPKVENPQIEPRVGAGLLPLYAARIIARNDKSRLQPPAVKEEVRKQLGLHGQLAPELWSIVAAD